MRLAINGYGRIGRSVLRALCEGSLGAELQVVAVNELADARTVLHLTRYDSTHGRFNGSLEGDENRLWVNGEPITLLRRPRIEDLPWGELGIDMVLECTGAFSDRATAELHLRQGAGKVLFSQPAAGGCGCHGGLWRQSPDTAGRRIASYPPPPAPPMASCP